MGGFFGFDRMITPTIIKIVFWLGLAISVITGLVVLFATNGATRVLGLVYLVLGPLTVRVYCELLIVVFKMHESLVAIQQNTAPPPQPGIPFLPREDEPAAGAA